jgi:translation elongation factor EF-G
LLVWLRTLSGTLDAGQKLVNVTPRRAVVHAQLSARGDGSSGSSSSSSNSGDAAQKARDGAPAHKSAETVERALRLLRLDADDVIEVPRAVAGDIVAGERVVSCAHAAVCTH